MRLRLTTVSSVHGFQQLQRGGAGKLLVSRVVGSYIVQVEAVADTHCVMLEALAGSEELVGEHFEYSEEKSEIVTRYSHPEAACDEGLGVSEVYSRPCLRVFTRLQAPPICSPKGACQWTSSLVSFSLLLLYFDRWLFSIVLRMEKAVGLNSPCDIPLYFTKDVQEKN